MEILADEGSEKTKPIQSQLPAFGRKSEALHRDREYDKKPCKCQMTAPNVLLKGYNFKKQSQFASGKIGVKSFTKGDYGNKPACGVEENKANFMEAIGIYFVPNNNWKNGSLSRNTFNKKKLCSKFNKRRRLCRTSIKIFYFFL